MCSIKQYDSEELHTNSIVIDTLAGTTFNFGNLKKAGLTAANITVSAHNEGFLKTIENIKEYYSAMDIHDEIILVRNYEDIINAHEKNKVGLILGFQTATSIEDDLSNIKVFKNLGIRIVQLTYMGKNSLGSGCYESNDDGLTYFGKQTIRELNRIGLVVDISHVGWETARDAIKITKEPIILSHTNPYNLCKNKRNVPDDIIKKVANTGGCIGINAHPALCHINENKRPTYKDYIKIIDYVVDLVGVDHVSIGMDLFDGFQKWQHFHWNRRYDELYSQWDYTEGMKEETDIKKITEELYNSKKYSDKDIKKILGENILRIFKEIWIND